jgi:hypothetical protein
MSARRYPVAARGPLAAFLPGALVSCALAACGGLSSPQTHAVSVRMRGGPPNASVTIDDVLIGPLDVVQARGVAIAPGRHHVSVEAAGYLPRDFVVDAKEQMVVLDVALTPIPD